MTCPDCDRMYDKGMDDFRRVVVIWFTEKAAMCDFPKGKELFEAWAKHFQEAKIGG